MSPARWLVAAAASLVVLFAVSLPEPASAQTRVKSARLCLIDLDRASTAERYAAFFDGLSALGYVEGRTLTIDWQSAAGAPERFPALARECVRLQPDVIVVQTTPAAVAAKQATPAIPIVMIGSGDPVGSGLVESLARPASNVTGLSFM